MRKCVNMPLPEEVCAIDAPIIMCPHLLNQRFCCLTGRTDCPVTNKLLEGETENMATAREKVEAYLQALTDAEKAREKVNELRPCFHLSGTFCNIRMEYAPDEPEIGSPGWMLNGVLTNTAQLCEFRDLLNELFPK